MLRPSFMGMLKYFKVRFGNHYVKRVFNVIILIIIVVVVAVAVVVIAVVISTTLLHGTLFKVKETSNISVCVCVCFVFTNESCAKKKTRYESNEIAKERKGNETLKMLLQHFPIFFVLGNLQNLRISI